MTHFILTMIKAELIGIVAVEVISELESFAGGRSGIRRRVQR
jgi:hypothetical protein